MNNHKKAIEYILDGRIPTSESQLKVFFKYIATHHPAVFVNAVNAVGILCLSSDERKVLDLAKSNHLIAAIKLYRTIHVGIGLLDAKHAVELLLEKYGALE